MLVCGGFRVILSPLFNSKKASLEASERAICTLLPLYIIFAYIKIRIGLINKLIKQQHYA